MPLACATARPGDELCVQVLDHDAAPAASPCPQVRIDRDLPDVVRRRMRRAHWAGSRASTYARRARIREHAVRSFDPDVCHIHYINRFTDPLLLRRLEAPLVVSVHDVVPHETRLSMGMERRLLRATYARAAALVVHHDSIRDQLLDSSDIDPARVHVIPHHVFDYGHEITAPPSDPHLLFFGTLRSNKGVDVLLDALPSLPSRLRVTIAGRGDAEIERAVRDRAAIDSRVTAEIGYASKERKTELFESCSVVVLPYTAFASQSGVLHDAYAHGRPVIVTDVGALGRSVHEDETGRVVPAGDPAALSAAIAKLLEDPDALATLGTAVHAVRAHRSPAHIGPRLRAVYDTLV